LLIHAFSQASAQKPDGTTIRDFHEIRPAGFVVGRIGKRRVVGEPDGAGRNADERPTGMALNVVRDESPGPRGRITGRRRALGFFAVCLGNFIIMLDTNIVNLALPHIRSSLGGSLGTLLWVVNGYTLTVAALILTGGAIGDRLGHDRVYRWGVIGFAATSLACGLSPSLPLLILFRALQGVSGAVLLPSLLGLIPHLYAEPARRARAVALWGTTGAVALAMGPLIAGALIDSLGWQAIFFINVPICASVYVLVMRTIAGLPHGEGTGFDLPGQVLAIVAMGAVAFVLIEGSAFGWTSPLILAVCTAGVLAIAGFVIAEARSESPLVPPRLFSDRRFTIATVNGLVFQFVYFGTLFLLPLYLQTVHRISALSAGLQLLPITVATALTPPLLTTRLMIRHGLRWPVFVATVSGIPGFLLVLLCDSTSPYWVLGVAMALQGVWSGLALPPTASLAVASPPPDLSGTGSGVFNAGRQLGGVLGVAVLGTAAASTDSVVTGLHIGVLIAAAGAAVIAVLVSFATVRAPQPPAGTPAG
jgi:MFS transporter, DHA2 family, methylenomycin A resistance protein